MKNFSKETKGITLVALVITIIILLILAGVTIAQLTGSGLFESAKQAENTYENKAAEENETLSEYENIIEEYLGGNNWIMDEEKGKITDGKVTLKVGDYINYQAKVINTTTEELSVLNTELNTYSGSATYSGTDTTNAIANEQLSWRVLDVVDGKLRLISDAPTSTNKIKLHGPKGYNNAVYLLDKTCSTLYNNTNYAEKVQNLKIEDIERHLTYDYTQYANSYVDTGKYGGTKEYTSNLKYPKIFEKEETGWVDGEPGKELGLSEQTERISEGSIQAGESIKITQTYWAHSMNPEYFKNDIYYNLFAKNGSNYTYWMSSRCVIANSNYADFCVRNVYSGIVNADDLSNSYANGYGETYAFRPVITLKSNVQINTTDSTKDGTSATKAYELN